MYPTGRGVWEGLTVHIYTYVRTPLMETAYIYDYMYMIICVRQELSAAVAAVSASVSAGGLPAISARDDIERYTCREIYSPTV